MKNLKDFYRNQYALEFLFRKKKRAISGLQSFTNLKEILNLNKIQSVADFGAGNGCMLSHMVNFKNLNKIHAFEISTSGINSIKKNLGRQVVCYNLSYIPRRTYKYDLIICTHVLEHIYKYKKTLANLLKNSVYLFIEIPLEKKIRGNKKHPSIKETGHVNFFGPRDLNNVLEHGKSKIIFEKIVCNSISYEKCLHGTFLGTCRYIIKRICLMFFGSFACDFFVYNKIYLLKC